MGSNGIVTETAHLNVDRKKYNEGYDRIFSAECMDCGTVEEKRKMTPIHDSYQCKKCREDNE